MAQPIPFEAPRREGDSSKEAVESALELLRLLHERGVLSLLRGLVGAGDQVVDMLAAGLDAPETVRGIRNFLLIAKLFAAIPPETLRDLAQTAEAGAAREKEKPAPGLWQLLRRLKSENTRHALSIALDVVEGLGKGL